MAGHIITLKDTHAAEMILNTKSESRRGCGRPTLRRLDDVRADIKTLGVRRWRLKGVDGNSKGG
jgi:hypothetical protein